MSPLFATLSVFTGRICLVKTHTVIVLGYIVTNRAHTRIPKAQMCFITEKTDETTETK